MKNKIIFSIITLSCLCASPGVLGMEWLKEKLWGSEKTPSFNSFADTVGEEKFSKLSKTIIFLGRLRIEGKNFLEKVVPAFGLVKGTSGFLAKVVEWKQKCDLAKGLEKDFLNEEKALGAAKENIKKMLFINDACSFENKYPQFLINSLKKNYQEEIIEPLRNSSNQIILAAEKSVKFWEKQFPELGYVKKYWCKKIPHEEKTWPANNWFKDRNLRYFVQFLHRPNMAYNVTGLSWFGKGNFSEHHKKLILISKEQLEQTKKAVKKFQSQLPNS